MSSAPKVATQEISDADLDNVAGGLGGVVGAVAGATPVGAVAGTVVGTALGTVDSVTGLNTSGTVGQVAGL